MMFEYVESRRRMGIYYRVIAEELEGKGYRSTRGKPLTAKLVERFYTKGMRRKAARDDGVSIEDITYSLEMLYDYYKGEQE